MASQSLDIDQTSEFGESVTPSEGPRLTTISEYDELLKWQEEIQNRPGTMGKFYKCYFYCWKYLIKLELFLQFLLLIVVCTGTYYGSLKNGMNIEKAMQMSMLAGVLTALLILFFHAAVFYCSSVQLYSGQRIRNVWHAASHGGFACLLLCIILVILVLARISINCDDDAKRCDIMSAITTPN